MEMIEGVSTFATRTSYFDAAFIMVHPETGRVWVSTSDGMCGYHRWTAIGTKTIWRFLANLDWHYFSKKVFPETMYEFDFEGSIRDIRIMLDETEEDIKSDGTLDDLKETDAMREVLSDMEKYYDECSRDESLFIDRLQSSASNRAWDMGIAEVWEITTEKRTHRNKMFFEEVWPEFIDMLKTKKYV